MQRRLFTVFAALLLAVGLFFAGCSDDDGGGVGPTSPPVDVDSTVQELSAMMQAMIDSMSTGGVPDLTVFDFDGLHAKFVSYLNQHPGDPTASFGAALTSIMSMATSDNVAILIDSVGAFLQGGGFLKASVLNPDRFSDRGNLMAFPTDLPSTGVPKNFLGQAYASLVYRALEDPIQFSDIQYVIRTEFIPAMDEAIDFLYNVIDHPDYVFWVTPEMTGGTSDSVEIDRPDFLAFMAGLKVISSFFHMAVAYNVDVPSLDSAGLAYMFDQSNNWMSLYMDGATQMAASRDEFLDAVDMVDSAISALQVEQTVDLDQSNDLIVANWSLSDYIEAQMIVDSVRAYMVLPQWVIGQFDADPEPDSVRIDVSKIFTNPINGVFNLLPPYTSDVTTGLDTVWYYYEWWDGQQYVLDSFIGYIEPYTEVTMIWNANTFAGWVFPNPTINGLLPDINTDTKFKALLGLTEAMWTKELSFRLYPTSLGF